MSNNKNENKADRINKPGLRSRATLDAILASFANRLREHPKLNEANVVVSDQAIPLVMPSGRLCLALSFGSGRFPQKTWESGHHATATCDGIVVVGIYQQVLLDRPGRAEAALLHSESILKWFQLALSMLTLTTPRSGARSPIWEPWKELPDPLDFDPENPDPSKVDWVVPLLRSIPRPMGYSSVADVPGHAGWIGMQINFACEWDWDLYAVDY